MNKTLIVDEIIENVKFDKIESNNTDEFKIFNKLLKINFLNHSVVNHKRREYISSQKHVNNIEGAWALLKRAWHGQHHQYSRKYTPLDILESYFKYKNRKENSSFIVDKWLKSAVQNA